MKTVEWKGRERNEKRESDKGTEVKGKKEERQRNIDKVKL